MKNKLLIVFTCDIDWAPEFAIDNTIAFFNDLGIKLTLFATHDSFVVKSSGLEIGIHPNLSRTTENNYEKVISELMNIYPDAKGSRTHRNYFGYTTPHYLIKNGLEYDISVINWLQPSFCNKHFTGLKTLTYSWEDGLHFDYDLDLSPNMVPYKSKICIYNVHPIVIYLNQNSEKIRKDAVKNISDLTSASINHLSNFVYDGYGIKNLIKDFVFGKNSITLKEFIKFYFNDN